MKKDGPGIYNRVQNRTLRNATKVPDFGSEWEQKDENPKTGR